jgi:hypothetical protein
MSNPFMMDASFNIRVHVYKAVSVEIAVFWIVTSKSSEGGYQQFK